MKNYFELIGRVTKEPKVTKTRSELSHTNIGIAISKNIKQQDGTYKESTEFINVSCWRNLADYIGQYIHKGDLVRLEGHIRIIKDFDVQRMINIYTTDLIGDAIKVLVRNKPKETTQEKPIQNVKIDDLLEDEDLPF